MGAIDRAWRWLTEKRGVVSSAHPRDPVLADIFGSRESASGARVTEDTALAVSTVYACVRILAETMGMMPMGITRTLPGGKSEAAPEHPLHVLLAKKPCPEMTAYTFRETLMGHLALRGNGLAYIQRNGAGRPIALWPLRPDRVLPQRYKGQLVYSVYIPPVNMSGWSSTLDAWPFWDTYTPVTLPAESVFHVRSFSRDGIIGISPVGLMREAVGMALATEEYGARFFSGSGRPSGMLEHPGKLSPEAAARLKASFEKMHSGLSSSHRLAILEEGMKWTAVGLAPDESQFLQTRKFQVEDIARGYRCPLHMVASLQNASYATVEQQGIDFSTYTMTPWVVRWEQEADRQLLTEKESREYSVTVDMSALLRGDLKSRYSSYQIGRNGGWLSVNDIRAKEGLNSIGDIGDIYLQPLNYIPAGQTVLKPGAELVDDPGVGAPATDDIEDTTNDDTGGALRKPANPEPEPAPKKKA